MAENLDERMADLSWVKRMTLDIPYGSDSPALRLDLFWPEAGEGPFSTLVYVHGGEATNIANASNIKAFIEEYTVQKA